MLLDKKTFFVKEQVAFLRLSGVYDIFDLETNTQIGVAKETLGLPLKLLRLLVNKRMLPTKIAVYEKEDEWEVFSIQKSFSMIGGRVNIFGKNGNAIGYFKSKVFSIGGGFWVYDMQDNLIAEIIGDWKGWNFRFLDKDGNELGTVTKKWAGFGKEMFTSADNYVISLSEGIYETEEQKILLIAAGLSIDVIYKEKK